MAMWQLKDCPSHWILISENCLSENTFPRSSPICFWQWMNKLELAEIIFSGPKTVTLHWIVKFPSGSKSSLTCFGSTILAFHKAILIDSFWWWSWMTPFPFQHCRWCPICILPLPCWLHPYTLDTCQHNSCPGRTPDGQRRWQIKIRG